MRRYRKARKSSWEDVDIHTMLRNKSSHSYMTCLNQSKYLLLTSISKCVSPDNTYNTHLNMEMCNKIYKLEVPISKLKFTIRNWFYVGNKPCNLQNISRIRIYCSSNLLRHVTILCGWINSKNATIKSEKWSKNKMWILNII